MKLEFDNDVNCTKMTICTSLAVGKENNILLD
jgi:hypothetical protein